MIVALIAWFAATTPEDRWINDVWPAELVAAQGHLESRFQPDAESRTARGRWCGIWQTPAKTDAACKALRDPFVAAKAYRKQVAAWMAFTHGDVKRALRGLGCGVMASRPGGICRSYDTRALSLAHRIRLGWAHWQVERLLRVGS